MRQVKVICSVKGNKSNVVFLKFFMGIDDYVIPTLKLEHATKFDMDDRDAEIICNFINNKYNEDFVVASVNFDSADLVKYEFWKHCDVHGHFKSDRKFNGIKLC